MWENEVQKYINEFEKKLISENEFLYILNIIFEMEDCPVEDILYTIDRTDPYGQAYIGSKKLTTEHDYKNDILKHFANIDTINKIIMSIKYKDQQNFDNTKIFEDLFASYWKPHAQRDINTLLMPIKQVNIKSLLFNTIKEQNLQSDCAFVFCDIDLFGEVNANYGQSAGDYAMRHLSVILERHTKNSILIHRSGDEFIIVHFSNNQHEILEVLYNIRRDVNKLSFDFMGKQNIKFTVSSGVYFIQQNKLNESLDLDDYSNAAEKALKPDGKDSKKRNQITICENSVSVNPKTITNSNLKISLLNSKINLLKSDSFSNIWLNYITNDVSKRKVNPKDLNEVFKEYLEEIKPLFNKKNATSILEKEELDYSKSFSIFDMMIALLKGLYLNKDFQVNGEIKFYFDKPNYILSINDSTVISVQFKKDLFKESTPAINHFEIPKLPTISNISEESPLLSTTLLVIIGELKNKELENLFSRKVIVDTRPTTGGGLPDFWESSLSKVLSSFYTNGNLKSIFLINQLEDTYTSQYLTDLNNGQLINNIDYIAYKTGLSAKIIAEVEKRINGNIHFIDEKDIVKKLFTLEFSESGIFDINLFNYAKSVKNRKGYLESNINIKDYKLNELDGCIGKTLSDVYPIIIYTMNEAKIYSQTTNKEFKHYKELIDFKVKLTNPSENKLPWFYEQEEKKFKKYFNKNFINKDGLFYKSIHEDNQEEVVISYLSTLLKSNNERVNSRRAIIILKNRINDEFPDPLGLTSIRIYLTQEEHITKINFTFIWRTVEAIVGFPYSAYGSIQYAEEFVKKLKKDLPNTMKITLGNLTYIAQTLHVFQDSYSENMAKNIIDEVTYY